MADEFIPLRGVSRPIKPWRERIRWVRECMPIDELAAVINSVVQSEPHGRSPGRPRRELTPQQIKDMRTLPPGAFCKKHRMPSSTYADLRQRYGIAPHHQKSKPVRLEWNAQQRQDLVDLPAPWFSDCYGVSIACVEKARKRFGIVVPTGRPSLWHEEMVADLFRYSIDEMMERHALSRSQVIRGRCKFGVNRRKQRAS